MNKTMLMQNVMRGWLSSGWVGCGRRRPQQTTLLLTQKGIGEEEEEER